MTVAMIDSRTLFTPKDDTTDKIAMMIDYLSLSQIVSAVLWDVRGSIGRGTGA